MDLPLQKESAFLAVVSLTEATATLTNFVKEGSQLPLWPFGENDVIVPLVEGLMRAAEIEQAGFMNHGNSFAEEVEQLGHLIAALATFCADWNGA